PSPACHFVGHSLAVAAGVGARLPFGAVAAGGGGAHRLPGRSSGAAAGAHVRSRAEAILLIYTAFFGAVYLFAVAIVPQLYRELTRISGNAVAFAQSLTPDRI